jgi:N4-gp56 family major capsid protein
VNVTGTSSQYDNAISLSDLAVAYSFGDVMKAAMTRLAYNAGLSIDTIVRNVVVPGATKQVATGLTSVQTTAIPTTGVMSIAELRKGIRTLKKNNAFQVGGALNANEEGSSGYWICTISPDQEYDLQGDQTTGAWIDANRYAGSEAIFEGEVGKLYGTRFLETSNGYTYLNSSVAASGDVHISLLTGSDYFGVTTMQNLQTFVKDFGSGGIADPTNKVATAGWKATFGATVLNSTFAVGIQTAVSA